MKTQFTTKDVETPKEGSTVYLNRYWICVDYDLKRALFYGNSPQCNSNKEVHSTKQMEYYDKNFKSEGVLTIVFAPISYVIKNN